MRSLLVKTSVTLASLSGIPQPACIRLRNFRQEPLYGAEHIPSPNTIPGLEVMSIDKSAWLTFANPLPQIGLDDKWSEFSATALAKRWRVSHN